MKTLLLVYALTCGADAASTHHALASGAKETVLSQSSAVNTSIIAAQTAGTVALFYRLNQRHPKLAKFMVVGSIVFRGWAAGHNLSVAKGQR